MFDSESESTEAVEVAASAWLARRDRGLTAPEQDQYLQWRSQDPRHAAAIAKLEKAWVALDWLAVWRPEHSPRPNPDLLAKPERNRSKIFAWTAAAASVTVLASLLSWRFMPPPQPLPLSPALLATQTYERQRLTDGSLVELNAGASLAVQFSDYERNVDLINGEAHFTVAKDLARPFVVRAGKVAIRAIGTAFNVRLSTNTVEVLVTEGRVHVGEPASAVRSEAAPPLVVAGQRAVISTSDIALQSVVAQVTPQQISQTLAWKPKRLEFVDKPLVEVIAEFNRYATSPLLVLEDSELGAMRIGGTFREDNVDAFVRLLETSFGLAVERREDQIVLKHGR